MVNRQDRDTRITAINQATIICDSGGGGGGGNRDSTTTNNNNNDYSSDSSSVIIYTTQKGKRKTQLLIEILINIIEISSYIVVK